MEYVLFLGFKRVGSFYPTIEDAEQAINGKGIWNICGVLPIDGKLKIVNRKSIVKLFD